MQVSLSPILFLPTTSLLLLALVVFEPKLSNLNFTKNLTELLKHHKSFLSTFFFDDSPYSEKFWKGEIKIKKKSNKKRERKKMSSKVTADQVKRGETTISLTPFNVKGTVIKGFGRGSKEIGIPTGSLF